MQAVGEAERIEQFQGRRVNGVAAKIAIETRWDSSRVTAMPCRASSKVSTTPAGPPPTTMQAVVSGKVAPVIGDAHGELEVGILQYRLRNDNIFHRTPINVVENVSFSGRHAPRGFFWQVTDVLS